MGGMTYEDSGVSIKNAEEAVERMKESVISTHQPCVLHGIGLHGGLIRLKPIIEGYEDPVLVQAGDGVGTKPIEAKPDTVGLDLIHHLANDGVAMGAKPVTVLDYIGVHKLNPDIVVRIVRGLSSACIELGCSLVGGEIAEMSLIYQQSRYDLVGFLTGIVEREAIIDGSKIRPGHQLIGLASNGVHTNGFSLARKVLFELLGLGVDTFVQCLGRTIGEELSRIHRCYVGPILKALADGLFIPGIAHITGSGIAGNVGRILPPGCRAIVHNGSWPVSSIFSFIQGDGSVDEAEMLKTFNMGIGMVVVVEEERAQEAVAMFNQYLSDQEDAGEEYAFQIGYIEEGETGVVIV